MSKTSYRVTKLLGEGSFGKAYLGEKDGQLCVIKQILTEGMTDQEKREAFNEAAILKKLDHPCIIKFIEVFLSKKPKSTLNIVTEFADGGDLSQKIANQNKTPFPESQIIDYITQICLALRHMHKKKIIHRDLKSGNVFLMKSGLIKLGDFGISKGFKNTWEKAKTLVGTPYYLSPEIISSKPYDSKSDIWALGVLLYELMTFKMPFDANSLPLLSIKINKGTYKDPPAQYSKELKDLLKQCLTIDPEKRPSTDDILQKDFIKKRASSFLSEVKYDKELTTTITTKYKQNKKHKKNTKNNDNAVNKNDSIKMEDTKATEGNTITDKTKESKSLNTTKKLNDTSKIKDFFKNKGTGKMKTTMSKQQGGAGKTENEKAEDNNTINKEPSNFLKAQNNKSEDVKLEKNFKEDDIGKTLCAKGHNDLVNSKGSVETSKITEDQYNQLRLLHNLDKLADEEGGQDSDGTEDLTVSTSMQGDENQEIIDDTNNQEDDKDDIPEIPLTEKQDRCKAEFKEIDDLKKQLEKDLGNDLFKEVYNYVEKSADKTEIKFDKEALSKKIMEELKGKGFEEQKLKSAIDKLTEIFAVVIKEKLAP